MCPLILAAIAASTMSDEILKPQRKQELFLQCPADITLFGGSRGGGKTYAALLNPLRHAHIKGFVSTFFRKQSVDITGPGGLWQETFKIYPFANGIPNSSHMWWDFQTSRIFFRHLQKKDTHINYQGASICHFHWEELTHFEYEPFQFMLGSNRSTCGVKPYITATCNPDNTSWVWQLAKPYMADDGYVDPEQNATIKHVVFKGDSIDFVEPDYRDRQGRPPKTVCLIVADVWDNEKLLETNPDYLTNLENLSHVDRERFLGIRGRGGNWLIRETAGMLFKRGWIEIVDRLPDHIATPRNTVRAWDFAATEAGADSKDPDCTASIKMFGIDDTAYIIHCSNEAMSPANVYKTFHNLAIQDTPTTAIRWEQEWSAPAKRESYELTKKLGDRFNAAGIKPVGDKITRFKPFSAACEQGRVKMLRGTWNEMVLSQMELFPDLCKHDDICDAASLAFFHLALSIPTSFGKFLI